MYFEIDDTAAFIERCAALPRDEGTRLMLLVARESEPHLDPILQGLREAGVPFFGGIFPGLILGTETRDSGAIAVPVRTIGAPGVARIGGQEIEWQTTLPDLDGALANPTCLILSDFACLAIDDLLDELFNRHAADVNYFGAGAGMGIRQPQPVVFTNDGRFTGAAVVVYLGSEIEVGLRHGWSRLSEPIVANATSGNRLIDLNWEAAMQVYRDIVGDETAQSLRQKQDVPRAKCFPFGIAREGLEDVIRDPIMATDDDHLVVLSNVPENAVLHVMEGKPDELISAASALASDFKPSNRQPSCLLFDCFSRAKLLGSRFAEELQAFDDGLQGRVNTSATEGVLALGEIASDGNRLPDFHNKTMAAALIFDRHDEG